jgi:DDE superfamily endonuclease
MCRDCAHSAGGIREFQTAPLHRIYGRAEPGERVFDKVPGDHGKNVSTIGAIGLDGIRTCLSVEGAIDGETMLFFVEDMLAPTLKRGEIVFMDNCSIHKMEEVEEAIEARGAWEITSASFRLQDVGGAI